MKRKKDNLDRVMGDLAVVESVIQRKKPIPTSKQSSLVAGVRKMIEAIVRQPVGVWHKDLRPKKRK